MKLFVAGLPYDLYDDELVEIFEKYGNVISAKVALDKETGKSRGFAFVEMGTEEEAKEAMEHLNEISLGKKPLVVKPADERNGPPPRQSGGGGNFRGGSNDSRGGGYGDNRGGGPGGPGGGPGGPGGPNKSNPKRRRLY